MREKTVMEKLNPEEWKYLGILLVNEVIDLKCGLERDYDTEVEEIGTELILATGIVRKCFGEKKSRLGADQSGEPGSLLNQIGKEHRQPACRQGRDACGTGKVENAEKSTKVNEKGRKSVESGIVRISMYEKTMPDTGRVRIYFTERDGKRHKARYLRIEEIESRFGSREALKSLVLQGRVAKAEEDVRRAAEKVKKK